MTPQVQPITKKAKPRRAHIDKNAATRLHSLIIRLPGVCEMAGMDPGPCEGRLEAAHFIRRRFSATRTDLTNAAALCSRHHHWHDDRPHLLAAWVDATRGEGTFAALQHKADVGIEGSSEQFWKRERAVLEAIARELGIK